MMKLEILGWKSKGLRSPDVTIPERKIGKVNLLQMPNGTGKTTTLKLIQSALSGLAPNSDPKDGKKVLWQESWAEATIFDFQKKGTNIADGEFVLWANFQGERYTFTLVFDFEKPQVKYKTTDSSGERVGHHVPPSMKRLINEKVVQFFVFDFELAQNMTSPTESVGGGIVEAYTDIYLLDQMSQEFETEKKNREQEEGQNGEVTDSAVSMARVQMLRMQEAVDRLKKRDLEQKVELGEKQKELDGCLARREKIQDAFKDVSARYAAAGAVHLTASNKVARLARSLFDQLSEPQYISSVLGSRLKELRESMDKLELPAPAAREFFTKLAESDKCICGRPIGEVEANHLKSEAEKYLGAAHVGVLNQIKTLVRNKVAGPPAQYISERGKKVQELKLAMQERQKAKMELNEAMAEMDSDNEQEYKTLNQTISKLEADCTDLKAQIDYRNSDYSAADGDDKDTEKIAVKNYFYERNRKILGERLGIKELQDKVKAVKSLLLEIKKRVSDKTKTKLKNEANQFIEQMGHSFRIESIAPSPNDGSIHIVGQSGLSVGQMTGLTYSFFSSVYNMTNHNIPLMVDSPLTGLDITNQKACSELLAKTIQARSDKFQFFALLHSGEKEVLAGLEKAGIDAQCFTIFRNEDKHKALIPAALLAGGEQTGDGTLVFGRDYFKSFDVREDAREGN
jgi:DNA sulfur modification protein DndD